MSENNNFENDYDSLKDVTEFQNNMFNLGHYIGTGKVPPTVSAPGNSLPMVIVCCFGVVVFVALCLFVLHTNFSAIDKIIFTLIMLGLSALFILLGISYFKKTIKYYKQKATIENEEIDQEAKDELWQRTCPKCGQTHDIDYPKCPNCKFNYLE